MKGARHEENDIKVEKNHITSKKTKPNKNICEHRCRRNDGMVD